MRAWTILLLVNKSRDEGHKEMSTAHLSTLHYILYGRTEEAFTLAFRCMTALAAPVFAAASLPRVWCSEVVRDRGRELPKDVRGPRRQRAGRRAPSGPRNDEGNPAKVATTAHLPERPRDRRLRSLCVLRGSCGSE